MPIDFKALTERRKKQREAMKRSNIPNDLSREEVQILSCIPAMEPADFGDLCNSLRKLDICPAKGDKIGWKNLFYTLEELENKGYLEIEKGRGDRIESVQLSEDGADIIRGIKDSDRGLLNLL